jgi:hypothetical protein
MRRHRSPVRPEIPIAVPEVARVVREVFGREL